MDGKVISFQDLNVYKRLYTAMLTVIKEVIPKLPAEEKFDLISQMRRCCKSPLAIIAEGYARKNYRKDWLKYINEAIGECNEMIAHLSCCRDIYSNNISIDLTNKLIEEYNISGKQLYRLGESWGRNREGAESTPATPPTHNSQHIPNPI